MIDNCPYIGSRSFAFGFTQKAISCRIFFLSSQGGPSVAIPSPCCILNLIIDILARYFQEAYKRGNNWLPPPWAILAMFVLGFNEIMLLLRYEQDYIIFSSSFT